MSALSANVFSDELDPSTTIIVPIIQPSQELDQMSDSDTPSEIVDMVVDEECQPTFSAPKPQLEGLSRKKSRTRIYKRKIRLERGLHIKQAERMDEKIRRAATQIRVHVDLDGLKPGVGTEQKVLRTEWITIPRPECDGPHATALVDNEGRIFVVRTTLKSNRVASDYTGDLLAAIQELENALRQDTHATKPHSDNDITFGLSYETGQTEPLQLEQEVDALRLQPYKTNISVQACVRLMKNLFRTWFPQVLKHGEFKEQLFALNKKHCHLHPPFPGFPFIASAVNVKPQDFKNPAFGFCAFVVLGHFDHKKGGKFRVEEIGVELEIAHGDIVICPAWMTYYVTAIASDETCCSMTFYTMEQNGLQPANNLVTPEEVQRRDMYLNVRDIGKKTGEASCNLETTT